MAIGLICKDCGNYSFFYRVLTEADMEIDPYEEEEEDWFREELEVPEEDDTEGYSYQCAECGSLELEETDEFESEISEIPFSLAFPNDDYEI